MWTGSIGHMYTMNTLDYGVQHCNSILITTAPAAIKGFETI